MTIKYDRDGLDTSLRPDGQQREYLALSDEERAKGFVRPVRDAYVHVGARPRFPTRPLTEEEEERYRDVGYVCFEAYPESERPSLGRYWTQAELDSGCGQTTTMARALAETYAREPGFYSGTFCATCRAHYPVGPDGQFVWAGTEERVGT